MFAQGAVYDTTGAPLPYASVFESDAGGNPVNSNGTQTTEAGTYMLTGEITSGYVTASYVGYSPITLPVAAPLNFQFAQGNNELPEVTVMAKPEPKWYADLAIAVGLITLIYLAIKYLRA